LARPVKILGDDGSKYFTTAIIWHDGFLLTDSAEHMASRIRDLISQAMTEFAAEYYKQNP
jgi:hypothetical protein